MHPLYVQTVVRVIIKRQVVNLLAHHVPLVIMFQTLHRAAVQRVHLGFIVMLLLLLHVVHARQDIILWSLMIVVRPNVLTVLQGIIAQHLRSRSALHVLQENSAILQV